MQRALFYDRVPSLAAPLRFFLSAPFFALIAAILLLWQGPEALASRWTPSALALTHLLTLGFLAMTMIGALIQILPVAANIVIPKANLTATAVHGLLIAGTVLLSIAFSLMLPALFELALLFLVSAFAWLLTACAIGLWQVCRSGAAATVMGIQMALVALFLTVALGATLLGALAWRTPLSLTFLTELHVLWGLLGWVGLLVMSVAYQVIPMFQVTDIYPRCISRWLAPALFLMLLLWSITTVLLPDSAYGTRKIASTLILASYSAFAIVTIYRLWHRKRPKAEATTLFWYTAMTSLLTCLVIWSVQSLNIKSVDHTDFSLTLGIVFIVGFAYSAINGMLYKIVPFLIWYHLQHTPAAKLRIAPKIAKIIPDTAAQKQFRAHLIALLLLVAATIWPAVFARPAALAFGISSCWLWINLLRASHLYASIKRKTSLPVVTA
ncbi:MAG: hypothetical protein EPN62_12865 [Candidimonas sp.]|nr:MAG: hypothetical protein EPN77_15660 [Candidimonas sp.]TAM22017.1 MAG: hypothetical protein EPN62_12865 [Candidimonas sp.]